MFWSLSVSVVGREMGWKLKMVEMGVEKVQVATHTNVRMRVR
jgi:hypothetical protein